MFRKSIRQKIVGIAAGLIVLAVITSALSMVMAARVGHLLDELSDRYVPAYGDLARANVRSLERALAVRQMIIARMENPPDQASYAAHLKTFQSVNADIDREAQAARKQIAAIIDDTSTPSDNAALGRLDDRIDTAVNDLRERLNEQDAMLLKQLDAGNLDEAKSTLAGADALREEFDRKIAAIRADMLNQVHASAATVIGEQRQAIWISAIVTGIAAVLGFVFAMMVGSGITGPVLRLLEGTREVEAGRLDRSISVTTRDEIGQLSAAFNRMIERLRQNQRVRETFGRYIDPRIAERLIGDTAAVAAEGQRRVMTVMFCDMKGFTALSEGVTPQGLVKIMNRYLSTMSEPIHAHRGVIDKYIGDAIMAYWGPPFVEEDDQVTCACAAAIDMVSRLALTRLRQRQAGRPAGHRWNAGSAAPQTRCWSSPPPFHTSCCWRCRVRIPSELPGRPAGSRGWSRRRMRAESAIPESCVLIPARSSQTATPASRHCRQNSRAHRQASARCSRARRRASR